MSKYSFLLFICLISCQRTPKVTLTIAAAANVQYALSELVQQFEQQTKIKCNIISSSSGKLTAQINEGAAYDIFFSADMKYPEFIFSEGLADQKPTVYALGSLVLWSTKEGIEPSLSLLGSDQIKHIALANPMTAPYGKAAEQILQSLINYEELKGKLVYGESIAQVNQFVNSGAAEIGITAKSVVLSPQLKNIGKWISIDDNLYDSIEQGMISLKNSTASDELKLQFFDFMGSEKAKAILSDYGYKLPKSE